MRRLALAGLVASAACGGGAPSPNAGGGETKQVVAPAVETTSATPPAWLDGTPPPELSEAEHFVVVVREATAEAALTTGMQQLTERIFRPSGGVRAPGLEQVLPEGAVIRHQHQLPDGSVAVLLAVRRDVYRDAALGWLSAQTDAAPLLEVPFIDQLRAAANHLAELRARRLVCDSLALQEPSACNLGDEAAATTALSALAAALRLSSPQAQHGIVVRRGELPVRPLVASVMVERDGQRAPLAGVPLRLAAAEACVPERATTAADGAVRLPFSAVPVTTREVRVSVDREADALWAALPELAVSVPLRELRRESARVAVHLNELVSEQPLNSAQAAGAMVSVVGARVAAAALMRDDLVEILQSPRTIDQALREIADGAAFDVVVVGSASASFANRMGARSVWFEATGKATLYDAWTGAALGEVTRTTQAVGLGDGAAAHKALAELGKLLGEDAVELLEARLEP